MDMKTDYAATKARNSAAVGYSTKSNHPNYISDPKMREKIGDLIEESTNASFYAGHSNAYFKAQIELLKARPQTSIADLARSKRTIEHFKSRITA